MTEEIRKKYQAKGWQLFPLNGKVPRRGVAWTKPFKGEWNENDGIGVVLGSKSNDLVDIDCDWEEASFTIEKILGSSTTAAFGRKSKPYSHFLVRCEEVKRITFNLPESFLKMNIPDEHGLMVAEIRGSGCYTMFPGSTHPSGEKVEWENSSEPRLIELDALNTAVGRGAFCAVCLRFWPGEGSRHDAALAFAGICKWAGMHQGYVEAMVKLVCQQQGDNELADRLRTIADTYKHDGAVSKWKKLQKVFGFPEDAIPIFAGWLGLRDHLAAERLNEDFAVIRDKSKVRVGVRSIDPIFAREVWDMMSETDFSLHQRKSDDAQIWLVSPLRREYLNGFVFDPTGRVHEGYLNLWKGWLVEPKEGGFPLFRQHITDVLAAGNEDHARYILNWIAFMIQKPNVPAEVALVFRGGKGVGKGFFGRALLRLCGQHGLHVSSAKMLVGDFNNHLRDCIFLFADESLWAGDKQAEGQLKRMITEDTLLIEGKGRDAVIVQNMLHIMIASNEDWVVPSSVDERRFAIFDASDEHRGDLDYFEALDKALETELPALLHWALNHDLKDWHPRKDIPRTAALQEQIERSENAAEALFRESLDTGALPGNHESYNTPNELVMRAFMHELKQRPFGRSVTPKAVSQMLQKIPGVVSDTNGYFFVGLDDKGKPVLKRGKRYLMPPLAECRKAFDPGGQWHDCDDWVPEIEAEQDDGCDIM